MVFEDTEPFQYFTEA